MESQQLLREGTINQYTEIVLKRIPSCIRENYEKAGLNLKAEAEKLIYEYIVKTDNVMGVSTLALPTSSQKYNLTRQRLYNIQKLKKSFDKNLELFRSDVPCDAASPFAQAQTAIQCGIMEKETAEQKISEDFCSWYAKVMEDVKVKPRDFVVEDWYGFSRYPALIAVAQQSMTAFRRYLAIDLTDFIVRYRGVDEMPVVYAPDSILDVGLYTAGSRGNSVRKGYDLTDIKDSPQGRAAGFPEDIQSIIENSELKLSVSSKDEQALLFWLVTRAVQDFAGTGTKFEVSGDVTDICRALKPGKAKYSSREHDYAKDVFTNIMYTRIWTKDKLTSVPLLGATTVEWMNGGQGSKFTCKLGTDLMSDLLFGRIGLVFKDQIMQLSGQAGLSRLLYPRLRRDRSQRILIDHSYVSSYTLIALRFIALPAEKTKSARITAYTEAFQEMKDKQILVQDYEFRHLPGGQEAFFITWLPLSEAEKKDLTVVAIGSTENIQNRLEADLGLKKQG